MSAFLCSDLHLSVIAKYCIRQGTTCTGISDEQRKGLIQDLANKLKRINIASVNYRYEEKSKFSRCRLQKLKEDDSLLSENDVEMLIRCWDYQACEDSLNLDYLITRGYLTGVINKMNYKTAPNDSKVWSI